MDVYLAFSYDENNQITMKGHASVTAGVACHRCAESVETEIRADIDVRIVGSEELATQLAQVSDVIVVTDNPAPVSELIEDDLIMSIPWRVCNSEKDCPNLNDAGSSERENAPRTESTQKPFANLRELLKP